MGCEEYQTEPDKTLQDAKKRLATIVQNFIYQVNEFYNNDFTEFDEEVRIQSQDCMKELVRPYFEIVHAVINTYHKRHFRDPKNWLVKCAAYNNIFLRY